MRVFWVVMSIIVSRGGGLTLLTHCTLFEKIEKDDIVVVKCVTHTHRHTKQKTNQREREAL